QEVGHDRRVGRQNEGATLLPHAWCAHSVVTVPRTTALEASDDRRVRTRLWPDPGQPRLDRARLRRVRTWRRAGGADDVRRRHPLAHPGTRASLPRLPRARRGARVLPAFHRTVRWHLPYPDRRRAGQRGPRRRPRDRERTARRSVVVVAPGPPL